MIKELLMFILLLQSSCGQVVNYSSDYSYTKNSYSWEQTCLNEGGILVDPLMRICIPGSQRLFIQSNPSTLDTDGKWKSSKTELNYELSKVEIIEIADHAISLNMYVSIVWSDHRLRLNSKVYEKNYLNEEEHRQIWSPQILIASNVKSENRKDKRLAFYKVYVDSPNTEAMKKFVMPNTQIHAMKKFHLSAIIKCDMDFQHFPFDEHICFLEVS